MSKNLKTVCFSWLVLIIFFLCFALSFFLRVNPVVIDFAISSAEGKLLNTAETAIYDVVGNGVTYDDISKITNDKDNNFKGVEINTGALNNIKGKIVERINKITYSDDFIKVSIPLGTLVSSEMFNGLGPKLNFMAQFYYGSKLNFSSSFKSTGINQTLHQIILNVDLSGTIVLLGKKRGFSTSTSAIIAQTVIIGTVPSNYTNFQNSSLIKD